MLSLMHQYCIFGHWRCFKLFTTRQGPTSLHLLHICFTVSIYISQLFYYFVFLRNNLDTSLTNASFFSTFSILFNTTRWNLSFPSSSQHSLLDFSTDYNYYTIRRTVFRMSIIKTIYTAVQMIIFLRTD